MLNMTAKQNKKYSWNNVCFYPSQLDGYFTLLIEKAEDKVCIKYFLYWTIMGWKPIFENFSPWTLSANSERIDVVCGCLSIIPVKNCLLPAIGYR